MSAAPFLWVALDDLVMNEKRTLDLARVLDREVEGNFGFKVNLDWVLARGIRAARYQIPGRPVFFDLKMYNGARTMASTFLECHRAGVAVTNSHAVAGSGSSRERGWELSAAIGAFRGKESESRLRIYAVTILTHYGEEYAQRMFRQSLTEVVEQLMIEGYEGRADGIIMPALALPPPGNVWPFLKILPGLRPQWYSDDRHTESYVPSLIAERTDVEAVCGSPITKSADPTDSLKRILMEIGA